jgi:hypothetical protein
MTDSTNNFEPWSNLSQVVTDGLVSTQDALDRVADAIRTLAESRRVGR